ncbi:hypothetical protein DICPUDRAFT_74767 [Dictyostelium purpureum]|uniref:Uncharacterized protein n=1 Tax=Dictyostelium purpureum TaxID=5786 RepID=F0Z8P4_DICPU|nr:uncharacterized protein DICPUDRAFT_74767 [Dictyostelium purpureum]EGC39692.1 hypothetical protein DICPUDRAFT_74767 [Dictyostelium purpureum]|eukprot:XP_003283801.1 hypothetical protein DICPUDRAFT_74767 [Dictyostelium purpureum]
MTEDIFGSFMIGIQCEEGVIIATEVSKDHQRLFEIDDNLMCSIIGTNDPRDILDKARTEALNHRGINNKIPMNVESCVKTINNLLLKSNEDGLSHGASVLVGGIDEQNGSLFPSLYYIDPSGAYNQVQSKVIGGKGYEGAQSILQANYSTKLSLKECQDQIVSTLKYLNREVSFSNIQLGIALKSNGLCKINSKLELGNILSNLPCE